MQQIPPKKYNRRTNNRSGNTSASTSTRNTTNINSGNHLSPLEIYSRPSPSQQSQSQSQSQSQYQQSYSSPRSSSSGTTFFSTTTAIVVVQLVVLPMQNLLIWFMEMVRRVLRSLHTFIRRRTGKVIVLDSGKRVRVGRLLAEGGFSVVLEAYDVTTKNNTNNNNNNNNNSRLYALKRIQCPEPELVKACQAEATVHRTVGDHPNCMPLLGMYIDTHQKCCYMLFPYAPHSLRNEVNQRVPGFDNNNYNHNNNNNKQLKSLEDCPWSNEVQVLQLFLRICAGVQYMHEQNYSHRDIKLENILFLQNDNNTQQQQQPVLMDFGSAGPLTEPITTRRQVLTVLDTASSHTTLPYRPPELLEGGMLRETHNNGVLDYTAVDVWSLGCTFHAMLYGASPAECEFARSDGRIQVTEVTQLSVLKGIPKPPTHSPVASWYSQDLYTELLEPMLQQDPMQRISLPTVLETMERLISQKGGTVVVLNSSRSRSSTGSSSQQRRGSSGSSSNWSGGFGGDAV